MRCRFAAAHQPFILVCGANHAQTSNGAPNYTSGDIPAHTEYAAAADVFARAIGAFITAHEGAGKSSRQAATDELLLMVRQTAELIGPYFMASGEHLHGRGHHCTALFIVQDPSCAANVCDMCKNLA